ncbi:MAG: hypothetical protein LAO51_12575 [Acidobacteriia bacterium]|nr:hypothetical protein [Terriglobia bacterium]
MRVAAFLMLSIPLAAMIVGFFAALRAMLRSGAGGSSRKVRPGGESTPRRS